MNDERSRKHSLMIRMDDTEHALLVALAETTGLSMNDVLRQALRAEARRRGVNPKQKSTKRGK